MSRPASPRVLIVSSVPERGGPQPFGLEPGGLPRRLSLRLLLKDLLEGAAARGEAPPLAIDTLHIPYRDQDYDDDLLRPATFPHRYDVAISHIVLNSGARVTDSFFKTLAELALEPHGQLLNPVTCIRKTTLHRKLHGSTVLDESTPCILKLDSNFNRKKTVFLCHTEEDVDAWRHRTPIDMQGRFVREPFYVDYKRPDDGIYRLERWMIAFGSLTVECRLSDDFYVKAATSFRYQMLDMRRLADDWRLLGSFGWDWRGESADCTYDEDAEAWDARYRMRDQVTNEFALHIGELDVIRTGRTEFRVIDVTNTGGVLLASRYGVRLTQARLLQAIRNIADAAGPTANRAEVST